MNVTTPKAQRAEILIHKNVYYALEDNTVIDHTDKPAKLFNDVIDYIEKGQAGLLEIRNPSIGLSSPNASQDWLGGSGIVGGSVVFNRDEEIKVKVRDGFAHCLQHPNYWFINCETNNVYTI